MTIFDTIKNAVEDAIDNLAEIKKQNPKSNVIEAAWDSLIKPVEGEDPAAAKIKSFFGNIVENMGNSIDQFIAKERNHYCTKQESGNTKQDYPYQQSQAESANQDIPHQDDGQPTDYTNSDSNI